VCRSPEETAFLCERTAHGVCLLQKAQRHVSRYRARTTDKSGLSRSAGTASVPHRTGRIAISRKV
jgi:hypothetical protein